MVVFDLDDTLYKERDYVFSAYDAIDRALSARYGIAPGECRRILTDAFLHGENPFDALLQRDSVAKIWDTKEQGVKFMLEIYRYHTPEISLSPDALELLEQLKSRGVRMGIITDGRSRSQHAKIEALGLSKYMELRDIIVSGDTGYEKDEAHNFCRLMQYYPPQTHYIYIGDNPAKDFLHPNLLGWTTVMLRDREGCNIHPQDIDVEERYRPGIVIDNLIELLNTDICL